MPRSRRQREAVEGRPSDMSEEAAAVRELVREEQASVHFRAFAQDHRRPGLPIIREARPAPRLADPLRRNVDQNCSWVTSDCRP